MKALRLLTNPNHSTLFHGCSAAFFFALTFSVLYSCIFIIFPVLYAEDHVFAWHTIFLLYVCVNILGNYFFGLHYDSTFKSGIILQDPPKSWHFCNACMQHCPPRSHHCSLCNACILKRDHHCFFLCQCVGLKNQKYFIVFALYVSVGSFYAMAATLNFLNSTYVPLQATLYSVLSYTAPGIFYNWLYADVEMTFSTCFCITVLYGCFSTSFGCLILFVVQCILVVKGQTPNEYVKRIRVQRGNYRSNFLQVFGSLWFLHLLFPIPLQSRDQNHPWGAPTYYKDV